MKAQAEQVARKSWLFGEQMILENYGRPYATFDAANRQHRQWFFNFLKQGTWGDCPVRFILDRDVATDVVTMIQRKLNDFYLAKEFGKETS